MRPFRYLAVAVIALSACAALEPAPTPTTAPAKPTPTATVQAAVASPFSYIERVRRLLRSNIVYIEEVVGNPAAEVRITLAPDGTILRARLVQSSGVPAWDEAVMRAVHKTGRIPVDDDGRVPRELLAVFRPKV